MILAYHGLCGSRESSFGSLHVRAERFDATLRAVSAVATFVRLADLLQRHRSGRRTRGLAAITFDDAYASVATEAAPIIDAHDVPATVFVIADAAGSGAPFWWDRIDAVFEAASPERWRSFESECGLPDVYREGQPPSMGRLRPFRQWMLATHLGRWPAELDEPLGRLEMELQCQPGQRPLTFDELDVLGRNPLVDFGVHTVSHPVLPLLPDDEIVGEVREAFDVLRARYDRTIPVLSIPFGLYDQRVVELAAGAGMHASLTLGAQLLHDGAPRSLLPRFCMTPAHRPWKAALYAMGCWRGIRPRARAVLPCPDLPSPTS